MCGELSHTRTTIRVEGVTPTGLGRVGQLACPGERGGGGGSWSEEEEEEEEDGRWRRWCLPGERQTRLV